MRKIFVAIAAFASVELCNFNADATREVYVSVRFAQRTARKVSIKQLACWETIDNVLTFNNLELKCLDRNSPRARQQLEQAAEFFKDSELIVYTNNVRIKLCDVISKLIKRPVTNPCFSIQNAISKSTWGLEALCDQLDISRPEQMKSLSVSQKAELSYAIYQKTNTISDHTPEGREIVLTIKANDRPAFSTKITEIFCMEIINGNPTGNKFHKTLNYRLSPSSNNYHFNRSDSYPFFKDIVSEFLDFIKDSKILVFNNAVKEKNRINNELAELNKPPLQNNFICIPTEIVKPAFDPASLIKSCERFSIDTAKTVENSGTLKECRLIYTLAMKVFTMFPQKANRIFRTPVVLDSSPSSIKKNKQDKKPEKEITELERYNMKENIKKKYQTDISSSPINIRYATNDLSFTQNSSPSLKTIFPPVKIDIEEYRQLFYSQNAQNFPLNNSQNFQRNNSNNTPTTMYPLI